MTRKSPMRAQLESFSDLSPKLGTPAPSGIDSHCIPAAPKARNELNFRRSLMPAVRRLLNEARASGAPTSVASRLGIGAAQEPGSLRGGG